MAEIPGGLPPVGPPPPPPKKPEGVKPEVKKPAVPKEKGVLPEQVVTRMDAHAIATRLAALAHEARERELTFEEHVEKAILDTKIVDPQAAMEEANRRLQKEIEDVLEEIKANRELMEEAEAWQALGRLLESKLTQEQINAFLNAVASGLKKLP